MRSMVFLLLCLSSPDSPSRQSQCQEGEVSSLAWEWANCISLEKGAEVSANYVNGLIIGFSQKCQQTNFSGQFAELAWQHLQGKRTHS